MQISFKEVSYSPARLSADGLKAVEALNFDVDKAGVTGIMGTADSGRRTVLLLLAAMLRPQKGHVLINAEDMNSKKYKSRKDKPGCAFVLRDTDFLFYEKSVEREFDNILKKREQSAEDKKNRIVSALESVGLEAGEVLDLSPAALSKCDRYKLSLALAVATEAEILLLEEPIEQLDAKGRNCFRELCRILTAKGCYIFISTNDADFLAEYANQVLIMKNGSLIRSDTARLVFADYYYLIRNELPVPSVKTTIQRLHERDVNIPSNIVDYEQFIDRLKIIMWRKQR